MRHVRLTLAALLLMGGCNQFPLRNDRNGGGGTPPPRVAVGQPSAKDLCDYLNANAARLQSIDCGELYLDAKQKHEAVSLQSCWMVCQKPRNFRMGAKIVGSQAVDMGSNEQEFWWWIKQGDPYLFHCSYEGLTTGQARMPFPFQPDWIMEALGMAEYGPPENYTVNATAQNVELIQQTKAGGVAVRKVTVFSRQQAAGNAPQVVAYILQDANGKEICMAQVQEVQRDTASGAVIPKKIVLKWPQESMELKMTLKSVAFNQAIEPQRAQRLFSRPQLAGVPTYDLTRGPDQPSGTAIRRTGSTAPQR